MNLWMITQTYSNERNSFMCVRVRACVCACVRACVRVYVRMCAPINEQITQRCLVDSQPSLRYLKVDNHFVLPIANPFLLCPDV